MKTTVFLWMRFLVVLLTLFLSACGSVQGEFSLRNTPSSDSQTGLLTPGSGNSQDDTTYKVEGIVTAIDANSITIDGVVYSNIANMDELANLPVGAAVKLEFTQNLDGTWTVHFEVNSHDGETPEVTETPEVDETPEPTETPDDQDEQEVTGVVTAIDATTITVDGIVYYIANFTEVKDTIQVGDVVELKFIVNSDGTLTATEISLSNDNNDGGDDQNDDGDDQSDDSDDQNDDSNDDQDDDSDDNQNDDSGDDQNDDSNDDQNDDSNNS